MTFIFVLAHPLIYLPYVSNYLFQIIHVGDWRELLSG